MSNDIPMQEPDDLNPVSGGSAADAADAAPAKPKRTRKPKAEVAPASDGEEGAAVPADASGDEPAPARKAARKRTTKVAEADVGKEDRKSVV